MPTAKGADQAYGLAPCRADQCLAHPVLRCCQLRVMRVALRTLSEGQGCSDLPCACVSRTQHQGVARAPCQAPLLQGHHPLRHRDSRLQGDRQALFGRQGQAQAEPFFDLCQARTRQSLHPHRVLHVRETTVLNRSCNLRVSPPQVKRMGITSQ